MVRVIPPSQKHPNFFFIVAYVYNVTPFSVSQGRAYIRWRLILNLLLRIKNSDLIFMASTETIKHTLFVMRFKYDKRSGRQCHLINFMLGQAKNAVYEQRETKTRHAAVASVRRGFFVIDKGERDGWSQLFTKWGETRWHNDAIFSVLCDLPRRGLYVFVNANGGSECK